MYFGLDQLPMFPFVGWTTVAVIAGCSLSMFVFALGGLGKRRAGRYFFGCLIATAVAVAGLWLWAIVSGQFVAFLHSIGLEALLELAVLLFITLFPFEFMALRYVDGLPAGSRSDAPAPEEGERDA